MGWKYLIVIFALLIMTSLLTSLILVVDVYAKPEASSWWNTNWEYRRRADIMENSGYSLTNFPVEVTLNHDGKAQPDGDDIRVVIDGTEILSYVSDINSTHAEIIFEVNVTAFSTKTIYVYYGNPDAIEPNYPLVPLTISEGNTGHAIIDSSIYIGWDYTNWGASPELELWKDFRIDFDRDGNPTNNDDLIRDWEGWQGGIGRRYGGPEPWFYGLGEYVSYTQTPIYVGIRFADETLKVYRNNLWVETNQADFLRLFSPTYDYMKYRGGTEMNIVDGQGNLTEWGCSEYYSHSNPGWVAYRDNSSGIVFASTGLRIGKEYSYYQAAKEFQAWDRDIRYDWDFNSGRSDARPQPSDCKIFWYGDNSNNYSRIEIMGQIFNNQPSLLVGSEETYPAGYNSTVPLDEFLLRLIEAGHTAIFQWVAVWMASGIGVIQITIEILKNGEKERFNKIVYGIIYVILIVIMICSFYNVLHVMHLQNQWINRISNETEKTWFYESRSPLSTFVVDKRTDFSIVECVLISLHILFPSIYGLELYKRCSAQE